MLLDEHITWSGEATIRSEYEGRWNWLFGANYQDDSAPGTDVPVWDYQADAELANFAVFDITTLSAFSQGVTHICGGPCLFQPGDPDDPFIRFRSDTDTKTAGVFLDGGVDITEKLHFQAGVRYSWTERLMRDTGHIDFIAESLDFLDAATFGFLTLSAPVCALIGNPAGCGLLQAQTPTTPLTTANTAFVLPILGTRKEETWDSVTGRARLSIARRKDSCSTRAIAAASVTAASTSSSPPRSTLKKSTRTRSARRTRCSTAACCSTRRSSTTTSPIASSPEVVNNVTTTVNAPEAQIYGVELQWIWAPIDRLQISSNVGWLHTEITADLFSQDNTVSATNPNGFCPFKPVGDQHGVGPTCDGALPQNLNGNVLPRSPEWNSSVSASYSLETSGGTLTPRVDFAHRGAVYYRQYENPLDRQGGYTRTDARLRFDFAARPLWVEVYAQNLEDNDKIKTQLEVQLNWERYYWLAAPQTFGIRFGWKFAGEEPSDMWQVGS